MSDTSIAGLAVRLVGSLAVVVGLLFLLARLANKRFKSSTGATVQVVSRQALSRGAAISVVTVGPRVLVVGTTEQQVTLLAELDPDELLVEDEVTEVAEASDVPTPLRAPSHRADVPVDVPVDGDADGSRGGRFTIPSTNGGALAGSILSPATWKQTVAAFKRAS
jgi:flagellar protein FliO/FliZ